MKKFILFITLIFISACSDLAHVGQVPELTPIHAGAEAFTMREATTGRNAPNKRQNSASLWTASRQSLFGDRRAIDRGDILTVVIEIDESAEFSNSSQRGRSGSESLGIPSLLGIPEILKLGGGTTIADAVSTNSSSSSSGEGSVSRNEKLELIVAATITDVLPNGVLQIQGSQEVRVNYEVRELLVEGFVRPEDISRKNEITYDKIASARISYGGRGQITRMQQPRYGQQIADILLPF